MKDSIWLGGTFESGTFEDSVCIIDEFQNLTKSQLAMVLSRLGKNSTMIFTGIQFG